MTSLSHVGVYVSVCMRVRVCAPVFLRSEQSTWLCEALALLKLITGELEAQHKVLDGEADKRRQQSQAEQSLLRFAYQTISTERLKLCETNTKHTENTDLES